MVQMRKWRVLLDCGVEGTAQRLSYRNILDGLARAIKSGRLPSGTALPGTREMATLLGVNRKTVILAYEEAAIKGWLTSEQRRGTFVNAGFAPTDTPSAPEPRPAATAAPGYALDYSAASLPAYFDALADYRKDYGDAADTLFFDNGMPDHRLLPQATLQRYYRSAMKSAFRADWVRYGNQAIEDQLRTALAEMLGSTRAFKTSPTRICLTQGTQPALHLIASLLIRPGDRVLVERLSYPPAWAIFRDLGADIRAIDVDEAGCVVQQIEAICQQQPIRFIYLTPHHQFPTTVSLRADRREKLLSLSTQHGFAVIEEDYDHEYHFNGRPYPPLASDPRHQNVIYLGSLSKLLGSTFRCAFIVAPENLINALNKRQRLLASHSDVVLQKMLAELIASGELRRHVRRSARQYRLRQATLIACLRQHFGDHIAIRAPEGGLALWVTFNDEIDVDKMVQRAAQEHLFVRNGRQFSPTAEKVNGLRLGFAAMTPAELEAAVTRLHQAWQHSRND